MKSEYPREQSSPWIWRQTGNVNFPSSFQLYIIFLFFINPHRLYVTESTYERHRALDYVCVTVAFCYQKIRAVENDKFSFQRKPLLDPFRHLSDFGKFSALMSVSEYIENMTCRRVEKFFCALFNSSKFFLLLIMVSLVLDISLEILYMFHL